LKCFSGASKAGSVNQEEISGCFFGQSSFASHSIVNETSVVNAKDLVKTEDELKLFAPLGCGIQTGSGTVVNVAKATPADTICIMGLGGVGLSAVMAAKISGCRIIIGVDRVSSRLELGTELGCTDIIDTRKFDDLSRVVEEVRKLTDDYGTTITIDTTGLQKLIEAGVEFTSNRGQYIQVGTASPEAKIEIPVFTFMAKGKRFIGAVEGQVIPQDYVPQMVSWYREGRFPLDRLVKLFKVDGFEKAIEEMHHGSAIKPIICWM